MKSRLARGRARLRAGLTRRGVAPASIGLGAAAGLGAVPDAWARDVVRSVSAADASSAGSARVLVLTREVLKTMLETRLLRVTSAALAFPMLALVAFAAAADPPPGRSDIPPSAVADPKGDPVEAIILSRTDDPIASRGEMPEGLRTNRAAVLKVLADCLRDPVLAPRARSWYRTMAEADPPPEAPSRSRWALGRVD